MLTSVGFCTYVTRTCLEATGGLVADGLEAGYGEEVEFCLRASLAGLTHVAATDCVVTHLGSASFGPAKRALVRCNESVLARRYPTYFARLAAQAAADPLRAARARIERALMATDGRKGGVALLGRDAEALLATRTAWSALQRGEPLRLLEIDAPSAPEATARMTSPGLLYPQNLAYRLPGERDQLAMDLAALGRPRLFVEPALLARAVEWLGTDNFSPLDADPPLSPPLPPEVRAGLDGETYAGLFI
jgi:hypothetical protein